MSLDALRPQAIAPMIGDPSATLAVISSRSGETIETGALSAVLDARLRAALPPGAQSPSRLPAIRLPGAHDPLGSVDGRGR